MKKILFISLAFIIQQSFAQVAEDALILSHWQYEGNARVAAMGGAFTALGGNLSSVSINPAGLALYRSSDISFSFGGNMHNSSGTYLNSTVQTHNYRTIIPNFGISMSAPNISNMEQGEGPKSWSFAIGYNQLYNYNQSYKFDAFNATDSYLDLVTSNINSNFDFYEIFYDAGLVFPDEYGDYFHDYNYGGYGTQQQLYVTQTGAIGEFFISGSANFFDQLYFGATMGIQSVSLTRQFGVAETPSQNDTLDWFSYNEFLSTNGIGINAKIGIIYAPLYWLKIGVSIHTPTVYELMDDFEQTVEANTYYGQANLSMSEYYPEYTIMSPLRINTGASFLILKRSLLSIDYEYVDHRLSQISSESYTFTIENDDIDSFYKPTHLIRAGAEYKLGFLALRAGSFYCTSPYQNSMVNRDSDRLGFSGGLGIVSGSYYFDFAFSQFSESLKTVFYNGEIGEVEGKHSRFMATIGYRF